MATQGQAQTPVKEPSWKGDVNEKFDRPQFKDISASIYLQIIITVYYWIHVGIILNGFQGYERDSYTTRFMESNLPNITCSDGVWTPSGGNVHFVLTLSIVGTLTILIFILWCLCVGRFNFLQMLISFRKGKITGFMASECDYAVLHTQDNQSFNVEIAILITSLFVTIGIWSHLVFYVCGVDWCKGGVAVLIIWFVRIFLIGIVLTNGILKLVSLDWNYTFNIELPQNFSLSFISFVDIFLSLLVDGVIHLEWIFNWNLDSFFCEHVLSQVQ